MFPVQPTRNIRETLTDLGLTQFPKLLKNTELEHQLRQRGAYTVFAPIDEAFDDITQDQKYEGVDFSVLKKRITKIPVEIVHTCRFTVLFLFTVCEKNIELRCNFNVYKSFECAWFSLVIINDVRLNITISVSVYPLSPQTAAVPLDV